MGDTRKPWEIPIQYNDWFADDEEETTPAPADPVPTRAEIDESDAMHAANPAFTPWPTAKELEEANERDYRDTSDLDEDEPDTIDDERGPDTESADDEPVDYSRGVHDEEFGVEEDYEPED